MTDKEIFIKIIQTEIFDREDIYAENYPDEFEHAVNFWEDFKNGKIKNSEGITKNGIKVLAWMQENTTETTTLFSSKEIGEGLFVSGRSVAGSMRKLVKDGYVEKKALGSSPAFYALTEKGLEYKI